MQPPTPLLSIQVDMTAMGETPIKARNQPSLSVNNSRVPFISGDTADAGVLVLVSRDNFNCNSAPETSSAGSLGVDVNATTMSAVNFSSSGTMNSRSPNNAPDSDNRTQHPF